jgi:hypothetical protein
LTARPIALTSDAPFSMQTITSPSMMADLQVSAWPASAIG